MPRRFFLQPNRNPDFCNCVERHSRARGDSVWQTDRQFWSILVMRVSLLSLTGLGIIAIMATDRSVFWAASLILGLFIGPCQSAARVWMAKRVPAEHTASMFGLFAFSGKVTSFIGPLLYGWLSSLQAMNAAGWL